MDTNLNNEIRLGAISAGQALAAFDSSAYPVHVFSERHENAMRRILSLVPGKKRIRAALKGLAACLAALLIAFAAVFCVPRAYAAVGSWFVRVWDNFITYSFPHSESDHAFVIFVPTSVPERFELISEDLGEKHHTMQYKDASTGQFIIFDHRQVDQKTGDRLQKDIDENATVQVHDGYPAIAKTILGRTTLTWYDKYTLTSFKAESDLTLEELVQAFSGMDAHLPEYVPTWIPEGFDLVDEYRDKGSTTLAYMHQNTGDVLLLEYFDQAIIDSITGFMTEADIIEETEINGFRASLGYTDSSSDKYDPDSFNNGTVLVWLDTKTRIIFKVDGSICPEDAIKIAERIIAKDK